MKAVKIEWVESNSYNVKDLPTEIVLPDNIADKDEAIDYISDNFEYGFYDFKLV
jgi:hypothetical protein